MITRAARLALPLAAVIFAVALGGCDSYQPGRPRPAGEIGGAASAASRMLARPAAPAVTVPPPAWQPDPAAVDVAERYATAALSYTWQQGPQAWIAVVAAICTPQWVDELRSDGDGGSGGWAAVVAGHDSATAHVLDVYPAAGPGPGRRLEVTARIATTSRDRPSTLSAAMAVDLLPQPGGAWLVGWAG